MKITILAGDQLSPIYTETITSTEVHNQTNATTETTDTTSQFQNTLDQKLDQINAGGAANELSSIRQILKDNGATEQEPIQVPASLEPIFREAAETYGVDEGLLIAMAKQESNFNTSSVSAAGAVGVMQLMPGTAAGLGVTNSYDPYQNIMAGAKLLSRNIEKYKGNVSLALAAYSAGCGAVAKYDGIPPYTETQNHIPKVLSYYARGYVTDSGSTQKMPAASTVASLITQYHSTKGSATGTASADLNASQKSSLSNLLMQSSSLLLQEQLVQNS